MENVLGGEEIRDRQGAYAQEDLVFLLPSSRQEREEDVVTFITSFEREVDYATKYFTPKKAKVVETSKTVESVEIVDGGIEVLEKDVSSVFPRVVTRKRRKLKKGPQWTTRREMPSLLLWMKWLHVLDPQVCLTPRFLPQSPSSRLLQEKGVRTMPELISRRRRRSLTSGKEVILTLESRLQSKNVELRIESRGDKDEKATLVDMDTTLRVALLQLSDLDVSYSFCDKSPKELILEVEKVCKRDEDDALTSNERAISVEKDLNGLRESTISSLGAMSTVIYSRWFVVILPCKSNCIWQLLKTSEDKLKFLPCKSDCLWQLKD
ncbi:hypothetical protein ACFE04_024647 [Oxalis oulophora]